MRPMVPEMSLIATTDSCVADCMLAIWLPSVFLGVVANRATEVPAIARKLDARAALARSVAHRAASKPAWSTPIPRSRRR